MSSTITPYEDGPLIVRGDFVLQTPDGAVIEPGRPTIALCRCGRSAIKPFCDGTHKATGFRASANRETAPRPAGPSSRVQDHAPHPG
jgi:CDGSH-type Zn-finger protein